MTGDQTFVDYYSILQVNQNCDEEILEYAYRHLAKMYHPDHTGGKDATRFNEVINAYRILRNSDQRAVYDVLYARNIRVGSSNFLSCNDVKIDEEAALNDADAHTKILMFLYERRRENAQDAGVVAYHIQDMLKCSDEHFEFHRWYLKEKGFITITEQGTLAITIQGVDHTISMSRAKKAEKLLIAQSTNFQD